MGLGNPGRRYRDTRHNAGFMAAEKILERSELLAEGSWPLGRLALVKSGALKVFVLEPLTFMNESGRAVAPVVRRYGLETGRLIVLHDDIDVPPGDVRVKRGGGTAGHQGLNSLVEVLGSGGFSRVRIGVGRPPGKMDPADYVLSAFSEEEREGSLAAINRAADLALQVASEVAGEEI